eukprot:scaffold26022_cov27-Prasinocladus_malaysianus.AAC.2
MRAEPPSHLTSQPNERSPQAPRLCSSSSGGSKQLMKYGYAGRRAVHTAYILCHQSSGMHAPQDREPGQRACWAHNLASVAQYEHNQ